VVSVAVATVVVTVFVVQLEFIFVGKLVFFINILNRNKD